MKRRFKMTVNFKNLQEYLLDHYGGRANEQGLFMKLVEEIGEVAEVLNKRAGRKSAGETDLRTQLGSELADVIHYAVAIAVINDIDLNEVIIDKDKKASLKYGHRIDLESFIKEREMAENA